LQEVIGSGIQFAAAVDDVFARHPQGLSIDAMYDILLQEAQPGSVIALLARIQFPVFSTFLKLTLLNHCMLRGLFQDTDRSGRRTFALAS
jgi:hypothetical protein